MLVTFYSVMREGEMAWVAGNELAIMIQSNL
jgi:hypothetical protein